MNLGTRRQLVFTISGILLAVILVGGIFWLWTDEDEVIIRRTLDNLVENAGKAGDEAPFVIMMQTQEIMKAFSEEPEIDLGPPAPERLDREELRSFILGVRNSLSTIDIRLRDVELEVAADRQSAVMDVEAEGTVGYHGETLQEVRHFRLFWIVEGGDWVIQRAELLDRERLRGGDFF